MSTTTTSPLTRLDAAGRATLFTEARTANTFADTPVSDAELAEIWELARWAPTSANVQPLRVTYLRTDGAKGRLIPLMSEGNRAKTASAPAVAILAADLDFHEQMHRTFPIRPQMRELFAEEGRRHPAARYNATLQAGYFVLAVRAAGLAAGPMLGYDGDVIDAEFFAGTPQRTVLVVNIGHPGEDPWMDRLPRLPVDEVVTYL